MIVLSPLRRIARDYARLVEAIVAMQASMQASSAGAGTDGTSPNNVTISPSPTAATAAPISSTSRSRRSGGTGQQPTARVTCEQFVRAVVSLAPLTTTGRPDGPLLGLSGRALEDALRHVFGRVVAFETGRHRVQAASAGASSRTYRAGDVGDGDLTGEGGTQPQPPPMAAAAAPAEPTYALSTLLGRLRALVKADEHTSGVVLGGGGARGASLMAAERPLMVLKLPLERLLVLFAASVRCE